MKKKLSHERVPKSLTSSSQVCCRMATLTQGGDPQLQKLERGFKCYLMH